MMLRATGTERLERVVLGSLSKVTRPLTSTAVCTTWIRDRKGSMSRRRYPAASPQRRPAYAPTKTSARYCRGISSTSRSTSSWDRYRAGFCRSVGSGIAVAGLNCRRLSAIAAAKHWRRAKTAFRVVAAERPLVKRSVSHCRTPLLVIARSGASPKRGRTCYRMVVSSGPRLLLEDHVG
jgi:hypothetical protein